MKLIGTILAGATLALAPAAMAQTTQSSPAPATPDASAQTTAPAAPQANGPVTDAEVDQFATAALEVEKIRKDTATPDADKGAKMAAAATGAGLTAERFNAIGQAMQSDPTLNKRIQAAATAKLAAAGKAPGSTQP